MGKLNQALNLRDGQGGKALAQFVDRLAEAVASGNGVGRDAGSGTMGLPESLPGTVSISSQAVQSISISVCMFGIVRPSISS